MSVNSMLYTVKDMAPAMLDVGAGSKSHKPNDLSAVMGGEIAAMGPGTSGEIEDKVSFTYDKIGAKVLSDLAGVVADAIQGSPGLDDDYVIAITSNDLNREANVYSRKEILDQYEGTVAEKEELSKHLDLAPLMSFYNAPNLPPSSSSKGFKELATNINSFIETNKKTINMLDKAGSDPFADLVGADSLLKILTSRGESTPKPAPPTPGASGEPTQKPAAPTPGASGEPTQKPAAPTPGASGEPTQKPAPPTPGASGEPTPKPAAPTPGASGEPTPKPAAPTPGASGEPTQKAAPPTPGASGEPTPKTAPPTPGASSEPTQKPAPPTPGASSEPTQKPAPPTPGASGEPTPKAAPPTPGASGEPTA